ncbi:hypothetical protein [Streptomyces sp. NPDC007074]|uniref:hypothetical protein n=1 Tax=Streptomyces sp. NPDC007074 TaxID=3156764 RepID=UPI0034090EC6
MPEVLPRTICAVDTGRFLILEEEAARLSFRQGLPVDWIREHVKAAAVHYLFSAMEHRLSHRPGCLRSGGASC